MKTRKKPKRVVLGVGKANFVEDSYAPGYQVSMLDGGLYFELKDYLLVQGKKIRLIAEVIE